MNVIASDPTRSLASLRTQADALARRLSKVMRKLEVAPEMQLEPMRERLAKEASFHRFDYGNAV